MLFKILATLFVTTSVTLVNAAPSPANNELDSRFSPAHNFGNALDARHARHHAKRSQVPKRNRRVRRSCPANTSAAAESIADVTPTPTDSPAAPADTPAQSPSDTPAAPADTPAPSSDPQPSDSGNSSSNDNSSSSTSSGDIQAYLDAHNNERANHGASALTWADDLAQVAQSWADGCVFQHSHGQYGENLAAGTGDYSATQAVQSWNSEASQYDPSNPQYSHWTQVVWKATQEVGCAVVSCPSQSIFGSTAYGATAQYYVCEYRPAGNVIGEFAQNVQA